MTPLALLILSKFVNLYLSLEFVFAIAQIGMWIVKFHENKIV